MDPTDPTCDGQIVGKGPRVAARERHSTHPGTLQPPNYHAAMHPAFVPGGAPTFDVGLTWRNGTDPWRTPAQVHNLDDHTVVIGPSLHSSREGRWSCCFSCVPFHTNDEGKVGGTTHEEARMPHARHAREEIDSDDYRQRGGESKGLR